MSGPVVAVVAVLGAVVGATVIRRVVTTIPEPATIPRSAVVAIALANGLTWALAAHKFHRWWVVVPYLVVFSALVAVSVVDLRLYRIPDRIVFPTLAVTTVLVIAGSIALHAGDSIKFALAGLVAYFGILFLFHVAYPRGMGFGDVKLAALMGLSLGWLGASYFDAVYLVLIALMIGCVLGIVFGLAWRLLRREGGAFPFGPALVVGAIYVILTFEKYLVI